MECFRFNSLILLLRLASMRHSIVLDFNVVLKPNLLPILLNFSDILGTYGIILILLGLSLV